METNCLIYLYDESRTNSLAKRIKTAETDITSLNSSLTWVKITTGGTTPSTNVAVSNMSRFKELLLIISTNGQQASTYIPKSAYDTFGKIDTNFTVNTSASAWSEGLVNITKVDDTHVTVFCRQVGGLTNVTYVLYGR